MRYMILWMAIVGFSATAWCADAGSNISTPQIQRSNKSVVNVPGRIKPATGDESQQAVEQAPDIDEISLWDAFHAGDYAAVRMRMAGIKKKHPEWQAPEELVKLLLAAEVDEAVKIGQRKHQYRRIIQAYQAHPSLFDCSHQYRRLALADAWLGLNAPKQAMGVYEKIHWQCKAYLRLEALEHAVSRMPDTEMGKLLKLSENKPVSQQQKPRMAALQLRYLLGQWQRGDGTIGSQALLKRADALQADVLNLKSAAVASSLGWLNLAQKRPAKARGLFALSRKWQDSNDALKGEILSLFDLGQFDEMHQTIQTYRERLIDAGMLSELLPLEASYCADKKDYRCQLDTLNQIAKSRPLDAGEKKSRAWALYHIGSYGDAAVLFEQLYRDGHDEDVGKGLYYSLQKTGSMAKIATLAKELDGALEKLADQNVAQQLFDRKLFQAAQAADEAYHPALTHADSDFVRTDFMRRVQSSSAAVPLLSTFELRKYILEGSRYWGKTNSINVQLERTFINAGDPLARANDVGLKLPGPYPFSIQSFLEGYEWDVEYRHQGWNSYYASIGQGFVGGPISATVKGRLGTIRQYDDGQVNVELYRQPLRDRIFAYVGMTEPSTGQHWGRVSRNGLKLDGYHGWGHSGWGLAYQASAELLNGVNVDSNSHYAVSLTVPYSFRMLDSINASLGPQVRWQRYANNQNHFTFGHGGYFSPQRDTAFGLNAHATTDEGRRVHAVFDGFVGRRSHQQDASQIFPLAPNGLLYPAVNIHETVYSARLAAVMRIGRHLQLGADVSYWKSSYAVLNVTTQINDLGWMAYLTWHFDARDQSLSMDHPLRGLSPLY